MFPLTASLPNSYSTILTHVCSLWTDPGYLKHPRIDIKLRPAVGLLPLLSPLSRSSVWYCLKCRWLNGGLGLSPITKRKCPCNIPEAHRESAVALSKYWTVQLRCRCLVSCIGQCPVWCECRCIKLERPALRCRPGLKLCRNLYER